MKYWSLIGLLLLINHVSGQVNDEAMRKALSLEKEIFYSDNLSKKDSLLMEKASVYLAGNRPEETIRELKRIRQDSLTAAHRTLAFGTLVRVVNLGNGRQVLVRINDRGPAVKSRILDLSRRAADSLRMIAGGTANVRLELLAWGNR